MRFETLQTLGWNTFYVWFRFRRTPRTFYYHQRNHTVAYGYVVLPQ
jgi:hypothetical protein